MGSEEGNVGPIAAKKTEEVRKVLDFLSEITPVEKLARPDALFVIGGRYEEVLERTARLLGWWLQSPPLVLVSGGRVMEHLGSRLREADWSREVLMKMWAVPKDTIVVDSRSLHTVESAEYGIEELEKVLGRPVQSLVVVAIAPQLRRIIAALRKQRPEANVFGNAQRINVVAELLEPDRLNEIFQEMHRLMGQSKLGEIAPVTLPGDIRSAVIELGGKWIFN